MAQFLSWIGSAGYLKPICEPSSSLPQVIALSQGLALPHAFRITKDSEKSTSRCQNPLGENLNPKQGPRTIFPTGCPEWIM